MPDFLIAEDEQIARDAIQARVESLGYTATAVGSIDEMWKALNEGLPKGILLDISLPYHWMEEIDWQAGIDLARELEKKHPRIPIILFTGRGDPFPEEEAKKLSNVIAFFRKPMPGLRLQKAIEEIMKGETK